MTAPCPSSKDSRSIRTKDMSSEEQVSLRIFSQLLSAVSERRILCSYVNITKKQRKSTHLKHRDSAGYRAGDIRSQVLALLLSWHVGQLGGLCTKEVMELFFTAKRQESKSGTKNGDCSGCTR